MQSGQMSIFYVFFYFCVCKKNERECATVNHHPYQLKHEIILYIHLYGMDGA